MPVIKISPQQMAAQWVGAAHKFQIGVHNFEVKAGQAAVQVFQDSFLKKRMNTAGSRPWAPWQGNYRGGAGLLQEFGTLRDSIKVAAHVKHRITIFTDPKEFNNSVQRHKGFCYAGVHNNLNSLVNKPKKGPKKERQFIGHSTVLKAELEKLSVLIFEGLPK